MWHFYKKNTTIVCRELAILFQKFHHLQGELAMNHYQTEKNAESKKKLASLTLGCKVNLYDTEAVEEIFTDNGYELTSFDSYADVYLINTCTVTAMSDKKSRQMIRKAKLHNPDAIVAVMGCYSQKEPEEILSIDEVNLVFGTKDRASIYNEVVRSSYADKKIFVQDIMKTKEFEELKINKLQDRTRAFVKIQEGCDRFCTYCIIPYTRGPVRSRYLENIMEEVRALSEQDYKEIVLTGIHVASYGKDLNGTDLANVIERIATIDGIERIRTSSVEPRIITDKYLDRLRRIPAFCPHFHLSLQSGSNSVLKRMGRRYTSEEYATAVKKIRSVFPVASITTDIIVGFPGETEKEFAETVAFLKELKLYETHVFKFSPRIGTPAAGMPNQIDAKMKQARSDELIRLGKENKKKFEEENIGRILHVLFEQQNDNRAEGHTENYIRVHVESDENLKNQIKRVRMNSIEDDHMIGTLC